MPIPFILAGASAIALGFGAQKRAKAKNEEAQRTAAAAQSLYNSAKASLENAQKKTESSLLALGYSKKKVLESSIRQFLNSYDKIKHINFKESVGINEISRFTIDPQDALQLQQMSNVYHSALSCSAAGVATGAVIALAASGSLPVVTGVLSTAGTAFMAGEVGLATGLAGSALSFAASITPLSAIAAPVMLFVGISANRKADENLEKAEVMYAEAEAASEKMKISETMCCAIAKRADMFDGLLRELNELFSGCVYLLEGVVRKKCGFFGKKKISADDFTEEEIKLVAVTRALAGAVKAVIDTPILSKDGTLSTEGQAVYSDTAKRLPNFRQQVQTVNSYDYGTRTARNRKSTAVNTVAIKNTEPLDGIIKSPLVKNIFALAGAALISILALCTIHKSFLCGSLTFAVSALLLLDTSESSKLTKYAKYGVCITLTVDMCILLFQNYEVLMHKRSVVIPDILVAIVSLIGFYKVFPKEMRFTNLKRAILTFFVNMFCLTVALLIPTMLSKLLGLSGSFSIVIAEMLLAPSTLLGMYICYS